MSQRGEQNEVYNLCIPYRDMPDCLEKTLPMVTSRASRLGFFNLIVVEQAPGKRFNLGKLLNVGFDLYGNGAVTDYPQWHPSDLYLFQPVDCVALDYREFRADAELDFKGFTLEEPEFYKACWFRAGAFRQVNGFGNEFWGWGNEDNDMFIRLGLCDLRHRLVPAAFDVFNYKDSPDFLLGPGEHKDGILLNGLRESGNVHLSGLNDLAYQVVRRTETCGIPHFLVDI